MPLQFGANWYVGLVAISIAATTARGQEWKKPSEGGREIHSIHTASWGVSNLTLSPDGTRIVSSNAGFPAPINLKPTLS
jgi:hypothetical protein